MQQAQPDMKTPMQAAGQRHSDNIPHRRAAQSSCRRRWLRGFFPLLASVFFLALNSSPVHALQLSLPTRTVTAGEEVSLPVMIDQVDNLAGFKLTISYDKDQLVFRQLQKSRQTSALMHVVNSKTPGRLIVVMAGARGIQGRNFPLAFLRFHVPAEAQGSAVITITAAELMSDALKKLDAKLVAGRITIRPATAHPTDQQQSKDAQ